MSVTRFKPKPFAPPIVKREDDETISLSADAEDENSEYENSEDERTTIFAIRGRITRSPTPSDEEDCSARTKVWKSRRRKEMRMLKATLPLRRPLSPERTLEEKRADRIRRYGYGRVDAWLERMIDRSEPPTEEENDYRWIVGAEPVRMLDVDKVIVVITIEAYEHNSDPQDPFVNDLTFTLQLQVHVPPQCGFMCYYSTSPPFVIDAWKGLEGDDARPLWVDLRALHPSPIFWVTRLEAIEAARASHLYQWNVPQKAALMAWCSALTRGSFADRKVLALYYPPGKADPPPFVVNPPARANDIHEDYLARRRREVGIESTPTRRGRVPLGDLVNTI